MPRYWSNIFQILQIELNLTSYYKYDQRYMSHFEKYIENSLPKGISNNLQQYPGQGPRLSKAL